MKLDMVFDIQEGFRKVLHAFSYPGEIVSFQEEVKRVENPLACSNTTQVLMYMLLDADTSFEVVSCTNSLAQQFAQLTYSAHKDIAQSRYVFVCESEATHLGDILMQVNAGTLEDPQLGATLIVECEKLTTDAMLQLQGPGIKEQNSIAVLGLGNSWIDVRTQRNDEYPIGIDMILVDRTANVVAIPRTTQIVRNKAWHM